MAYASKDLSVLAYANGFTLWHYATTSGRNHKLPLALIDSIEESGKVGTINCLTGTIKWSPKGVLEP